MTPTRPRPLDAIRSFKVKTAVVVGVALFCSSLSFWATAQWQFRYALLMALVVALVVTWFLAHGMTSPLREMTGAVRAMSHGDYSGRVRATSRDEIGTLATAFNQMAADLSATDTYRREVVGNVAHELRTPVAALHAVLENLVDGVSTPDHDTLALALSQTDRLGRLVDDLLDLSRVEGGAIALDRAAIDLHGLTDDAVAECLLRNGIGPGSAAPVTFRNAVPPGMVVHADEARMHQVFANLLDDAARHASPDGVVDITARVDDTATVIDVADDGPGIEPVERTRIFERFTRGGSRDGGTGLGLAIAHWVVRLHDGEIAVVDDPAGCRIRIRLPSATPG